MKQNNRQKPPSVSTSPLCAGTVHDTVPIDLRKALLADAVALCTWNDITPLARNEWICWVESSKSIETRMGHVSRAQRELAAHKRRPCCWIGCIHRTDKPLSPSVHGILAKKHQL